MIFCLHSLRARFIPVSFCLVFPLQSPGHLGCISVAGLGSTMCLHSAACMCRALGVSPEWPFLENYYQWGLGKTTKLCLELQTIRSLVPSQCLLQVGAEQAKRQRQTNFGSSSGSVHLSGITLRRRGAYTLAVCCVSLLAVWEFSAVAAGM